MFETPAEVLHLKGLFTFHRRGSYFCNMCSSSSRMRTKIFGRAILMFLALHSVSCIQNSN